MAETLRRRELDTAHQICARLLEDTGVAILPGTHFGGREDELTARLAFVDFDGAQALAAAEVLPKDEPLGEDFLRTSCGNTLTAIERLGEWVAS